MSGPNYDVTTLAWHVSRPLAARSQRIQICVFLVCETFTRALPLGFFLGGLSGRSIVVGRLPGRLGSSAWRFRKGCALAQRSSRSAVRLRSASSEALLLPDRLGGYFLQGDGSLLATGSYDGQARVWTKDGEQQVAWQAHMLPRLSFFRLREWPASGLSFCYQALLG